MSIGDNLKKKREEAGMTQVELAKRVGVSFPMISQIERGTKSLSLPLAKAVTEVLCCGLEDLLE